MNTQRWTLVVVCAATAMLMLDIAVVNTALSRIAEDLQTTGLFNPAVTNVALSSVPVEQSGVAAGVNDTFRQAGIAVGVAALGALIPAEHAIGGGSAVAYVNGLHDALWAGGALALVGAFAAALLISKRYGAAAEMPAEEPAEGPFVGPLPEPA